MPDDEPIPRLWRRKPAQVATAAYETLDPEIQRALAEWTLRAGLGSLFLLHEHGLDLTPEETGALLATTWRPYRDPVHWDVLTKLNDWADGGME